MLFITRLQTGLNAPERMQYSHNNGGEYISSFLRVNLNIFVLA